MRIAIHTLGTRGDVQPYLALALGLEAAGHDVRLAAPEQFTGLAEAHRVAFSPLPGDFLALLDTAEGKAAIAGGRGFSAGFQLLGQVRPLMRRLLDAEWQAARDFSPDILVHHPKSLAGPHLGEALDRPTILASPLPGFTATGAFPSPLLPFSSLGPLNRASHALAIHGGRMLFGRSLRKWRHESLGLPGGLRCSSRAGTLYAYSRHVVPVPADWGEDVLVGGYWFLDEPDWRPDLELAHFLASGEAPVYVGFGSMPGIDPERLTAMIGEALARCGRRGVLATGGGAIASNGALAPHLFRIGQAPHAQLLPLMEAAMHHGGAGTTAAALRAGIPSIICPFFGDQPFWGRRIAELGAGPPPLDRQRLSVDKLAEAFATALQPAIRARAADLGRNIRNEDGIAAAIDFVERRARRQV